MNEPFFIPRPNGVVGSELLRMQRRDKSMNPQRSVGTLTSHTTEGVIRTSTAVADWPRAAKAKQARWA